MLVSTNTGFIFPPALEMSRFSDLQESSMSFEPVRKKQMRKSIDSLPGMKRYRREMQHEMPSTSAKPSGMNSRKKSLKDFSKKIDAIYAH